MKAKGLMFDAILGLISRARAANKYMVADQIEDMVEKMVTSKNASVEQARKELLKTSSLIDDLLSKAQVLDVSGLESKTFETEGVEKKELLGRISNLEYEHACLQKKLEEQILSLNSARHYFRAKFLDTNARPKL